jgi:hypothetical protein
MPGGRYGARGPDPIERSLVVGGTTLRRVGPRYSQGRVLASLMAASSSLALTSSRTLNLVKIAHFNKSLAGQTGARTPTNRRLARQLCVLCQP